jgi:hypothetical protein
MKRTHYLSVLVAALSAAALGGTACSAPADAEGTGTAAQAASGDNCSWWAHERAARQATFDSFLATNADAFKSFKNTALGNLGVPMIMMRVLPEIFPEIWGAPADNFAPVGFAADPYEPTRTLPLGLGFAGSTPAVQTPAGPININVVTLTCMGCHGGRVQGADGVVHTVPGAPNTQFDGFRTAVYKTVNDPRYTVANFRAALNAHPLGWVYGDAALAQQEAIERGIFNAPVDPSAPPGTPSAADLMLGQLQAGSNFGAQRFAATLGTYTYYPQGANAPDPAGHTPGYLDAIGAGITIVVDPTVMSPADVQAALPPFPAMIDIMSVWTQADRPAAQWDGSIQNHLHRNLAAEFGVIGDPTHVSMQNADVTTAFTDAMPSPPYPFDVDTDSAARGQHLYNQYCASCHTSNNATIFPTTTVGTDPNRAIIWKPYSVGALRQVLKLACTDTTTCNQADGSPLPDTEIVNPTGGYMALPLNGIWARAPYLHNGSVPTLAALLTGDRPAQFYRGNVAYDEKNVGFVSTSAVSPHAAIYDTTKSGNSNVGHSSAAFTGGVNWKAHPGKLADLLEYMKTL